MCITVCQWNSWKQSTGPHDGLRCQTAPLSRSRFLPARATASYSVLPGTYGPPRFSLKEVVLGGKISAPTPTGLVTMTVPEGFQYRIGTASARERRYARKRVARRCVV